ncbi:6-carboxytetrahydropterin synthase QueD [bacterium]|nr:6-carboxytetrahydropterin synthase QueD [bacterium]
MPIRVTRELQLDAGHRIPSHKGACCNVHGHRYRIAVTVEGDLTIEPGHSDEGMVMDFADLKVLMVHHIHEPLDHGFMAWHGDEPLVSFLRGQGFRLVLMDAIPTAENLARWCHDQLVEPIRSVYGGRLRLESVTVWETPNNCAVYTVPK